MPSAPPTLSRSTFTALLNPYWTSATASNINLTIAANQTTGGTATRPYLASPTAVGSRTSFVFFTGSLSNVPISVTLSLLNEATMESIPPSPPSPPPYKSATGAPAFSAGRAVWAVALAILTTAATFGHV